VLMGVAKELFDWGEVSEEVCGHGHGGHKLHTHTDDCGHDHGHHHEGSGESQLRFKVGDLVQTARGDEGWVKGKVILVWDEGNAYRIELEDGYMTNVWAPEDSDEYVRERGWAHGHQKKDGNKKSSGTGVLKRTDGDSEQLPPSKRSRTDSHNHRVGSDEAEVVKPAPAEQQPSEVISNPNTNPKPPNVVPLSGAAPGAEGNSAQEASGEGGCAESSPLLNEFDESTNTPGLFLVGPSVRHKGMSFCFVYKFRQRFGIVADAIARGLGYDVLKPVKDCVEMNMFMDDLKACENACGEIGC